MSEMWRKMSCKSDLFFCIGSDTHKIQKWKNVESSLDRQNACIFRKITNFIIVFLAFQLPVEKCRKSLKCHMTFTYNQGLQSRKVGSRNPAWIRQIVNSSTNGPKFSQIKELIDSLRPFKLNVEILGRRESQLMLFVFFKTIFPKKEEWLNYLKYFYNYFQIWC